MDDLVSRQAVVDEVGRWTGYLDDDMIFRIQTGIKRLPSVQPEIKPIDYQDCSNAMLRICMDKVVTDSESWKRLTNIGVMIIGMNETLTPNDFGTLAICAIRYCQGRQTYMPSLVRGIIRPHLKELNDKDLHVMINDCDYQEHFKLYGSETIDKPGWIKWREELVAEKDRRGQDGQD